MSFNVILAQDYVKLAQIWRKLWNILLLLLKRKKKLTEYILFLKENKTKYGIQYTIKSISFGRYNISINNKIKPHKSKINYLEEAISNEFISESQEICDNYNKIKSSVLDKYLD